MPVLANKSSATFIASLTSVELYFILRHNNCNWIICPLRARQPFLKLHSAFAI